MFYPQRWAKAFMNSFEKEGADIGEGIEAFRILAAWAGSLPGAVFGSSVAKKAEAQIRRAAIAAGIEKTGDASAALEIAVRFLVLMIGKNVIRHADSVIEETKRLLNRKNGIVKVTAEYAFPPGDDTAWLAEDIRAVIKKRTGAARVDITGQVNAELIGGYRLCIGDEIIDASVRSQLLKLENFLTKPEGGN